MKINTTSFGRWTLAIAAVGMMVAAQNASATLTWSSPLTSSSPNLVGIAYGVTGSGQGSDPYKLEVAQELLNLGANQDVNKTIGGATTELITFSTDYNGTVITSTYSSGGAGQQVGSGWDYVIAKYDGKNAGYVLFCLNGQAADLPQFPNNFWTTSEQYGISGWTAFDTTTSVVPEPSTVVAGALLLLPLAVASLRRLRKQ